ncbi:MAG: hypothetical protein HC848_11255, partial [Limnobacter sp.]|nr:hypothetical protein [Limnobacter sp.]
MVLSSLAAVLALQLLWWDRTAWLPYTPGLPSLVNALPSRLSALFAIEPTKALVVEGSGMSQPQGNANNLQLDLTLTNTA